MGGPGVELVDAGGTHDDAGALAIAESRSTGAVYVHPFDDRRTIAGPRTVAVELDAQHRGEPGTVIVPAGQAPGWRPATRSVGRAVGSARSPSSRARTSAL